MSSVYDDFDKSLYRTTTVISSGSVLSSSEIDPSFITDGTSVSILNQSVGNLASGKTKFDNSETGYIIGIDNGVPKLYIGTTTAYFNFTGSTVTTTGIVIVGGAAAGFTISATALTATAGGNTTIVSSGATAFTSGPTGSPTFTVTQAGVMTTKSATIGNWTVNATSIYTGTEDHSGYTANAGDMTLYSDGSNASIHANQFYIDNTGSIYATSGAFTGTLTIGGRLATIIGGAIDADGDFVNDLINTKLDTESQTILSDFNFGSTNYAGAVKAGDITWNTTTGAITGGSGVVVYRGGIIGAATGVATFTLDATTGNATFAGTLSAAAGTLGSITAGTFTGISIAIGSGDSIFKADANGIYLGNATFASAPFRVNMSGDVTATSATITGAINATSGKFGTSTNYWSVGATGLTAVSASTDVIINYGKTDFGQDSTGGFILGYDYSASVSKFEMGSSASKILKYDGTDIFLIGGDISGATISGSEIISSFAQFSSDSSVYPWALLANYVPLNTNGSGDTAIFTKQASITDGNTYLTSSTNVSIDNENTSVSASTSFTGTGTITISQSPNISGQNHGSAAKQYKIEIDGTGNPNTFKWSDNNGVGWVATGVAITGSAQTLTSADGSYVQTQFSATTGGVMGDYWTATVGAESLSVESVLRLSQHKTYAIGEVINIINDGTGKDIDGNNSNWYCKPDGTIYGQEVQADGDIGGLAGTNALTGVSNVAANSTGVGTIKFKGTGSRDSSGFIKVYIGTTAYYIPVFNDITT